MGSDKYWERYYNRVEETKGTYFFEKLKKGSEVRYTFSDLLKFIKADLAFSFKSVILVFLNIRKYGSAIRSEYGLSYIKQWYRLMYLIFVMRTLPVYYRTRLLFKPENWKNVNELIFTHHHVQKELAEKTYRDEIFVIENKFEFYKYCQNKNIPTPEILAVFQDGEEVYWQPSNGSLESDLFLKRCTGGKGKDAQKFSYSYNIYMDKDENTYTQDELINYFKSVSQKKGRFLVQTALKNHDSWMKFTSGSLATCRLVTAKNPDNGEIVPLFCCLKMPVGNSDVDNYALGALITPVDLDSGKMEMAVTSNPINGKYELSHHPDTGHQFVGSFLPHWQELKEFTLQSHKHFQSLFVGWDVSYTGEGCSLIEGNITWASGSYEIPFQDSLKNTIYPELFERWMDKFAETE